MDFGEVLTKAWKIVWKFKILWIFGIFAGCGIIRGGSFNGSNGYRTSSVPGFTPNLPPGFEDNMLRFLNFIRTPTVFFSFIIGILGLFCVIFIIKIFFNIVGRVGLIKGAMDADAGAEHLGFVDLWKSGLQYFWRFLGLSLIIGSPVILIFFAIGSLVLLSVTISGLRNGSLMTAAPAFLALISVICVFSFVSFLLAIVISFLGPQAERAIMVENEGVISGIRRGWKVLTMNLGPILIVWLIVVVLGFVAGILVSLPLLIVVVPAFIAFMVSWAAGGNNLSYTPLIFAGLCIVAYIPVSLVANGILTAYIESVWTLTYLRLTQPGPDALPLAALPNA